MTASALPLHQLTDSDVYTARSGARACARKEGLINSGGVMRQHHVAHLSRYTHVVLRTGIRVFPCTCGHRVALAHYTCMRAIKPRATTSMAAAELSVRLRYA